MKSPFLQSLLIPVLNAAIGLLFFHQSLLADEATCPVEVLHCTVSLIDQVVLAADRPGILGEIYFEEGDEVPADTLVAQYVNDEAQAQLELATAAAKSDIAVRLAEKARDVAEVEWQQALQINRQEPVHTEFEMRRLKLAYDQAILEREQAVHDQQLRQLEQSVRAAQLKALDVRSTFAGTVVRVYKKKGEAVQQGEPLLEIVSTRRLRIEGYVPVKQIDHIALGDQVEVLLQLRDQPSGPPLPATLKFIDLSVQSVTQEVRLWAELVNLHNHLRPGQQAVLRIRTASLPAE